MRSRSRRVRSSSWPMRLGRPLKNQTCDTGAASSMWPMRSRRTRERVTSTPHLSQTTPRCFMRLYLPHKHSQSVIGTEDLGAEETVPLGLERAVVDGLRLGHLAEAPRADLLRRRDGDRVEVLDLVEKVDWFEGFPRSSTAAGHIVSSLLNAVGCKVRSQAALRLRRLQKLDIQTQALELADQHVERSEGKPGSSGTSPLTMAS